ncbi:MAG: sigma-70 family RNA polymerase sigma factor [Chloroflexota bacterium]|nr:sigma-70 family RNA polymerase sigma factor [Chloroflexota bacterium]
MTEQQAIELLKHGDISGLELLVQNYYVLAVRSAYFVNLDRALAEDIVQAAFLRVYERIDQFDAARPFRPWFLRMVVNDAHMAVRKRARLVTLNSEPQDDEYAQFSQELPGSDLALDELMIEAETTEAVWLALGKLSPDQRAVIVLRYYLGLSEAEMSTQLDCTPGTVKSRLHRAKRRLRQLMPTWLGPVP